MIKIAITCHFKLTSIQPGIGCSPTGAGCSNVNKIPSWQVSFLIATQNHLETHVKKQLILQTTRSDQLFNMLVALRYMSLGWMFIASSMALTMMTSELTSVLTGTVHVQKHQQLGVYLSADITRYKLTLPTSMYPSL
jgi:hypothetical protein